MAVDTFFVGALKGAVGVSANRAGLLQAPRLGTALHSKLPVTSVHVLNETVLPFFEAAEARV